MEEENRYSDAIKEKIRKVDYILGANRGTVEALMHVFLCEPANITVTVDNDVNDLRNYMIELQTVENGKCPICGAGISKDPIRENVVCKHCGYIAN